MDYLFFADSTCDIEPETYLEYDINPIYMTYIMDGKEYVDNRKDMGGHEFFEKMREGCAPSTVQINMQTYKDMFSPVLAQGKDVFCLTFSSALSRTYLGAKAAAAELAEEFPGRKILVLDSLSACSGEGLLAINIAKKRLEGLSVDELYEWASDFRFKVCHFFMVDDLFHLHRGGRVSKTAAVIGGLVGIKPAMYMNNDGQLIVGSKARGRNAAFRAMADRFAEAVNGTDNPIVYITHCDVPDDAEILKEMVLERCPDIKNVNIVYHGPVIGAHVGPGCLALFGVGKGRYWLK